MTTAVRWTRAVQLGAERFVVPHADGRSTEDEATGASPVGWAVRAGSEEKLSGESTGHQERGPDCPQQHADQDPVQWTRTWRIRDGAEDKTCGENRCTTPPDTPSRRFGCLSV